MVSDVIADSVQAVLLPQPDWSGLYDPGHWVTFCVVPTQISTFNTKHLTFTLRLKILPGHINRLCIHVSTSDPLSTMLV